MLVRSGEAGGFLLSELRFPAGYVQAAFEPQLPYLALILEGGLEKSFPAPARHDATRACMRADDGSGDTGAGTGATDRPVAGLARRG